MRERARPYMKALPAPACAGRTAGIRPPGRTEDVMKRFLIVIAALLAACGGGTPPEEDADAPAAGTTAGAEAVQAMEIQNTVTAIPQPMPGGIIRDAREAADAANAHVQEIDSIMGGL